MPKAREREANVWGKRSEWVDYSGKLDGETVGVVMMDHPGNPRHPTYWHSRGYGLHSINPFGVSDFLNDKAQNGSLTLEAGEHVRFRYRVIVHPGESRASLAAMYKQYASQKLEPHRDVAVRLLLPDAVDVTQRAHDDGAVRDGRRRHDHFLHLVLRDLLVGPAGARHEDVPVFVGEVQPAVGGDR